MNTMPLQPYMVEDFSGGETDYFLQGDKKRYQFARNYLIDPNKKLFTRPGSQGFDFNLNHLLPGSPTRVNAFLTYNERREMLVQQAQDIYYLEDQWKPITGPDGLSAAPATAAFDSIDYCDWNGHTYFTTAGADRPGKIYRDSDGKFQVRTAGMPYPVSNPVFTKSTLLPVCIALANDLRTSMVSHMNDVTNLHTLVDKWSMSYFETQVWVQGPDLEFPGPLPTPTPAPAASDEASLYALVYALCAAFEHHGKDPSPLYPFYHKHIFLTDDYEPAKGPYKLMSNNTLPKDLEVAAAQLNELRQKWYWHRLGLFTHSQTNSYAEMNLYPTSVPEIQNISYDGAPYVTSNTSEFIRYANYLKELWNTHVTLADKGADFDPAPFYDTNPWHAQAINADQDTTITIPDAKTVNAACLIIYWVWALYGRHHFPDANVAAHTNFTFSCVAGSNNISAVKDEAGSDLILTDGAWVWTGVLFDDPGGTFGKNSHVAQVVSAAAGTAILSKNLVALNTGTLAQESGSLYHGSFDNDSTSVKYRQFKTSIATGAAADDTPTILAGGGLAPQNIAMVPIVLQQWADFAADTFKVLLAHVQNKVIHQTDQKVAQYLYQNGPFYKPQIASYSYAFVYKYTYTTKDGIEFETEGEPLFVGSVETAKQFPVGTEMDTGFTADQVTAINADNIGLQSTHVETIPSALIQNLPQLRNTNLSNYDTAKVKIEIFRTQDGGNTYYLLDEVDNGTETFLDVVSDETPSPTEAALSDRQPLYTTGGEVAHVQAPTARFMHILDNTAYYAYITDTGQVFKNRILQSIPGSPDSVPPEFSDDLDDEIMGITSARSNIIVLCRNSVYRLSGTYNNLGSGAITHENIMEKIGCVSSKSIVQTETGVFFAGTDGFYWTDGFQYVKISIDRDLTYKARTRTELQASRIVGSYDQYTRRIWWSMQSLPNLADVDESHVFYLDYGVKPGGVFTSADNESYWSPTCMYFLSADEFLRGDRRGVIFRHNPKWHSDPKIPEKGTYDDFLPIDQWGTVHVPYRYASCALDFGTIDVGNYVTKIKFMGTNVGNAAAQVLAVADNNGNAASKRPLAPMMYSANPRWGDARVSWGTSNYNWKYDGKMDERRRFPKGNLHAQLKQIEIVPARVGVYRYDDFPEDSFVSTDSVTKVATIATPDGFTHITFPYDAVGMFIAFESDDYVQEFEVAAWEEEELHLLDPNNLLEDLSDQKWVIRGYLKEGALAPLSYSITFANFGERGSPYPGSSGRGENG